MALKDVQIRNAKPREKQYKLFDERGLFLIVTPKGKKWWRFRYAFDGKEKLLSLGTYPDVSLEKARERRETARKLLADKVDPGQQRKAQKATKQERLANSFEVVAREWYAKYSPTWVDSHGERIIRRFERDIFPWLGEKPIADITPPDLLAVIRRIEERGALETAHRALANCGQVFRYAIATSRALRDTAADLRGALPPVKGEHFAAVTEPKKVAELLRALDGYQGTLTVICALRLAPLVFVRPGELRKAEWKDIDLETAEWRYIVTKTDTPHIVPLATQAVAILQELYALTGLGRYVFPGARSSDRPMSDNAILAAMRRLGIGKDEMSGHGFRAMARTILDEELGEPAHLIEHQLAHAVKDPNGRAYNRTKHLPERHKMMQRWADYLDKLKGE
ncbi:tyrosine-type recombinase/integrase [Legionella cincinnatiensis]|uniref:Integrase n=1 Tax=Legionella cincinnatiensis TaxID=28085 RepID=A0A378IN14_9GAMM|nr:integrase arm-type DNA-binding domain-containing protein [Legionella cincinnatiensis]KTC93371.1 integrase [Legionella cincinnatiensis]STX36627.1 Integrase [Legionella cincinnatiensis]